MIRNRSRDRVSTDTVFIGADNGLSGGVAVLDGRGKLLCRTTMPVVEHPTGRELDAVAMDAWLRNACAAAGVEPENAKLTVERPGGSKSYKAAVSMAGCFHAFRAMAEVGGWRMVRITPQRWQKKLLNAATGDTKPAALRKAKELWPLEDWLETPKCRTPHDGMVDAALIAYWRKTEGV